MADDDDQSSIPSVVDGMTPVQRTSVLSALMDRFAADFSHYVSAYRRLWKLTRTGIGYAPAQNIPLNVHPIYLFRLSDEPLHNYLTIWDSEYIKEQDIALEPTWLMPVIPMVLVNGGIGTKYNPKDVIANIRRLLSGEEFVPMDPWFDGKETDTSLGVVEERAPDTTTGLDTSNMLLLDTKGRKKKYGSPQEILKDFFALRLESYEERKLAMLEVIKRAVSQLEDKAIYDGEYCSDTVILDYNKNDEVLYAEAKDHLSLYGHYLMGGIELEYDLETELRDKTEGFDILKDNISVKELWLNDLDALEEQLNVQDKDEAEMRKKRRRF